MQFKRRLLVIDDDESICELLQLYFESAGYLVQTALSPLGVLDRPAEVRADVILLDVMLSWVDGFQVCQALKSHPETKNIPVLMISARGGADDIQRGLSVRAEDYITKPFNLPQLRQKIDDVLSRRGVLESARFADRTAP